MTFNQNSIETCKSNFFRELGNPEFRIPLYDSYCFSNIPGFINAILTNNQSSNFPIDVLGELPKSYDKVILFFVDAFGWRFFEKYYEKLEFLNRFVNEGVVSKLTSQFPSSTSCHVTCIHTSLSVGESGIYDWHYYDPVADEVICPLTYCYATDFKRDTLKANGIEPSMILPENTLYQNLLSSGVNSTVSHPHSYANSEYSKYVSRGASISPYISVSDIIQSIETNTLKKSGKNYHCIYIDKIDSLSHKFGPDSKQVNEEIFKLFETLETDFFQKYKSNFKNTALILIADHGQTNVNPDKTLYLNLLIPNIKKYLKTNKKGNPILFGGNPRDVFLYVKEELVEEFLFILRKTLEGKAKVILTKEYMQILFGKYSKRLEERVGNVLILPFEGETAYWYEKGIFEHHFFGQHGGLLSEEMDVPFAILGL